MTVEIAAAAATSDLRRAILRPAWPPGTPMPGDAEPDAVHLAARSQAGALVGACVLLPRRCPAYPERAGAWQLRGMATAPHARGTGIGTALTDAAAAAVRERGGTLLWCEARESAIDFYRGRGFEGRGATYPHAETGAPHLLMVRELSRAPASSTQ